MGAYFGTHTHTMYSNIRLLDCINRPKDLIDKAIELGLSGITITDHECLSAHMQVNQYAKKLQETNPDFTIALGNEIYLTDTRDKGQKYYHFILIAKDAIGHKCLRELSSTAWYNSYFDRGMERVPLLKSELADTMKKYKGHVIATTACIGGELGSNAVMMAEARAVGDNNNANIYYQKICSFIDFCVSVFGDDFYLETAPSTNKVQCAVNKIVWNIGKYYHIPVTVGTDAHYLTEKERPVHKAYLNSKDGEREIDTFYEFARLMDYDECQNYLALSFDGDMDIAAEILENTKLIQKKISTYSIEHSQIIPKVDVPEYHPVFLTQDFYTLYPIFSSLLNSNNLQEKAWACDCYNAMREKHFDDRKEYWERLEIEADIIQFIGNKLNDCLFAYFNTFKHYINLFWECGSIVGPGRGSATGFLSNYLLGITQLDPIRWDLPYWRFLNKERAELPDIDIDLAPSKRPAIFTAIRKERGEFGLIQVATFGTEGTKSAILTACRGYRSEEYPDGIDSDAAQYMSSMVPQHRGFLWSIHDVVFGNEDEDRKPVTDFIREVNQYPGLLDIIISIEGLVNKRSSHASGVILYGEDPFETASFMRTPSGDLITCYDLHEAEAAGDTKYDFLVTEASDKIIQCYQLLLKDKQIEDITLREFYNKYLHPEVMDVTDQRLWDHLGNGDVLDVFQFATGVGLMIAKKLKPQNMLEMTAASALMRLMAEKGKESPQDRYVRIQHNPKTFEQEMQQHGLTVEQREAFHHHCDTYYGTVPLQEQMMEILMDKDIAHFSLAEANAARKIVAKKQMKKIPELREQLYESVQDNSYSDYIWEIAIAPSLGYAFSKNHSLPYSFVGIQMVFLATNFNPIYWNTACLIVNSGSLEEEDEEEEEIVSIYEPEDFSEYEYEDLPGRSEKKKKKRAATDYGKIAKAIGDIQASGIKVSLVDINSSGFGFSPDIANNQILFGLKGMLNVGDDVVNLIIENRPYASPKDFLYKVKPGKQAMISLIKGGAFDNMMERKEVMVWYVWETCDKKKRITLQNMGGLIKYGMLPEDTEERVMARRVYEFNRYLKSCCKTSASATHYLVNDDRSMNFLAELESEYLLEIDKNNNKYLNMKNWDKVYQYWMDIFRNWIAEDKDRILQTLNEKIFLDDWIKYASGNYSSWEMEVLCFYYHRHELADVNQLKYGFADFTKLPFDPEVEYTFKRGGRDIPIYKLTKLCGTCIAKNKTKSTVTLLTTTGVVELKFRKEYFTLFDKQISERGNDGVKHIVEKSWFNRGSMIVVMGMRSEDNFIVKKYASSVGHQLYKIDEIMPDGNLILKSERYKGEAEDE